MEKENRIYETVSEVGENVEFIVFKSVQGGGVMSNTKVTKFADDTIFGDIADFK